MLGGLFRLEPQPVFRTCSLEALLICLCAATGRAAFCIFISLLIIKSPVLAHPVLHSTGRKEFTLKETMGSWQQLR
jgi:hypothetical protein